jgi:hypothetical protein
MTATERLYPHPLHQGRHMPAADLAPLGSQQVAQQPTAGEGELQMQLVNPPHEREVGCRHRPGQVIDTPPTDVQRHRLLCDRIVWALRGREEISSAPPKNSFAFEIKSPFVDPCND